MTDKLLCPFCQQKLEKHYWDDLDCYACSNLTCDGYYMTATQDMWKALIDTKKGLDIAVDALKNATEYLGNQEPLVDVMAGNLYIDLSKALEQINEIKGGKDE